jgi:serine protease Do
MPRRLKIGLLALFFAGLCLVTGVGRWAPAAHAQDSGISLREAERSVVHIVVLHLGPDNAPLSLVGGSGFVVAPGKIITNFHVVQAPAGTVKTLYYVVPDKFAGDVGKDAKVLQTWPEADLALLSAPDITAPALKIAAVPPGKEAVVRALGYPGVTDRMRNLPLAKSLEPSEPYVTSGSIALFSDTAPGGAQIDTIFHTAPIDHGNSGGPLLDECDRVIGVNTWGAADTLADDGSVESHQGQFAAIRSSVVARFLEKSGVTASIDYSPCVKVTPVDPAVLEQVNRATAAAAQATAAAKQAGAERDQLLRYGAIILGVLAAAGALFLFLLARQTRPLAAAESSSAAARNRGAITMAVWVLAAVVVTAVLTWWLAGHFPHGSRATSATPPPSATVTLACRLVSERSFNPLPDAAALTIHIDPKTGCVNGHTPYDHGANGFTRVSLSDTVHSASRLEISEDLKSFTRRDFALSDAAYKAFVSRRQALGVVSCPIPGDAASAKATAEGMAKTRALAVSYLNTEAARVMAWRCDVQTPKPAGKSVPPI